MANMIPISTVTVGSGGASSMSFTNIPQNYTDLMLKISNRSNTTNVDLYVRFNGSSSNLSDRLLYGTGSAAASSSNSFISVFINSSGYTANTFASTEVYIPNYTSSNYKSTSADMVTETNATNCYMGMEAGLWSNTAPITQIDLVPYTGTLVQYSSATLYGIRKY